jgi:hypothetical protein
MGDPRRFLPPICADMGGVPGGMVWAVVHRFAVGKSGAYQSLHTLYFWPIALLTFLE